MDTTNHSRLKDFTGIVLAWFLLMVWGPYIKLGSLPIRPDHILFPLMGTGILLICSWKQRNLIVPRVLYGFLGFLGIAAVATLLALTQEEFFITRIAFLAALENHLRIVLIFLLVAACKAYGYVDYPRLIRGLIWCMALVAVLAFFQMYKHPEVVHEWVKWFSVKGYTGRNDRGVPLVKILIGIRAVATFYLPGNYALFSATVLTFLLFARDRLNFNRVTYIILLIFGFTGLLFSGSKGAICAVVIWLGSMIILRKWRLIRDLVGVLIITGIIAGNFSHGIINYYLRYFVQKDIASYYNHSLGQRYGAFVEKPVEQNKVLEESAESRVLNEGVKETPLGEPESSDSSQVSPLNPEASESQKAVKTQYSFNPKKGNLTKAIDTFKEHKWLGVGYVSNVAAGDSMIIHLLTRGGIMGFITFSFFIFSLCVGVYRNNLAPGLHQNEFAIAWVIVCIIFYTGGIAYPSFVQDRTGDIFWWLGALLVLKAAPSETPNKA